MFVDFNGPFMFFNKTNQTICNQKPTENSTEKSGYWGDYHSCDSPGYLVQNILENMCAQLASNHKVCTLIGR